MKLDRIDARILSAMQKDCRLTSDRLSEIVNLSPTAVQRRLKQLRKHGVIESDVSIISPKAVGRPVQMVVAVTLEREGAAIIDRFKQLIRATPEIMSGFYIAGDADFILVISARSMEDYEEFTRNFFYENNDIKSFKTYVVMDRVKSGFSIPIEISDGTPA